MPYRFYPRARMGIALAAYLMFALGGVLFIFVHGVVQQETQPPLVLLWHIFLISGGLLSAVGVMMGRRGLEAAALILVATAVLAYAAILVAPVLAGEEVNGARLGVGCLLFGLLLLLSDRGLMLFGYIRAQNYMDKGGRT